MKKILYILIILFIFTSCSVQKELKHTITNKELVELNYPAYKVKQHRHFSYIFEVTIDTVVYLVKVTKDKQVELLKR